MIARTVQKLRRAVDGFHSRKATVALVPTMGALHDGHVSLVRLAKRRAKRVIVSIFVNPTQFAPTEDFGSYPRTWKSDLAKLAAEKVDVIWHPDVKVMYPDGFATRIVP
jgi:pantoate--beta-alanine ligase